MRAAGVLLAFLAALVLICVLVGCVTGNGNAKQQQETKQQESERPLARALDMTVYDPPEWSRERISDVWKFEDRLKNRVYWLIKIDGQWIALDLGEVENLG